MNDQQCPPNHFTVHGLYLSSGERRAIREFQVPEGNLTPVNAVLLKLKNQWPAIPSDPEVGIRILYHGNAYKIVKMDENYVLLRFDNGDTNTQEMPIDRETFMANWNLDQYSVIPDEPVVVPATAQ
jgi:hypothetical protein